MNTLLPFLRARLAERSSRVQLLMLVLFALVAGGVFTIEDLKAYTTNLLPMLAVLGPLAGVLVPDTNHAVNAAASQDAAVAAALDAATAAAEKAAGPEATAVAKNVAGVVDALGL